MVAQSTGKRIRLTERDLLWMQAIHHHGPLSTSELLAFSEGLGQNKARAQNRLTDLFNEANTAHHSPYLSRPPQQFQTIDARYKPLIYGLTDAGQDALKEADMWSDWVHKAGGPFWHQREVAKLTAGVEIDCLKRPDRNYIQGWRVLERAQRRLRYPVTFSDPSTGKTLTRDLIPDQIFGIEYLTEDGPRYKWFVVEVERGTNPKTSKLDRKSVERMEAMYEVYIGKKEYKRHLQIQAPLLLLCFENSPSRERRLEVTAAKSPWLVHRLQSVLSLVN
ncbi:hypothetical protein [Planktotalea sp.]|uniref:hypothetical protein n=1 Tax=Planktotalea sp. TaxID=2029877 RepID=UPI003D6C18B8